VVFGHLTVRSEAEGRGVWTLDGSREAEVRGVWTLDGSQ
jgi:hypothetical protein